MPASPPGRSDTGPPPVPDLHGRKIVVTGASRGIGASLAIRATALGAAVAGCSRSEPVADLAVARRLDVADGRAVGEFAAEVFAAIGTPDLWINNAAVIEPLGPLRDRTATELRRLLDVNVVGVWNGSTEFVLRRRAHGGGGCLINVTSGAAVAASAGTGFYSASKAAVDRLTEATALEEAVTGLDAWAIQPGVVDTGMQAALRACSPDDLPRVAEFRRMAEQDSYNRDTYVADWLLAIAFDRRFRPPSVVWRLPDQWPRPATPVPPDGAG